MTVSKRGTPKEIPKHPGSVVLAWLQANNITIAAFAEHVGITRPFASSLLHGKRRISVTVMLKFAHATGIPVETLLQHRAAHDIREARLKSSESRGIRPLRGSKKSAA
jgi:antitoxin HigA-1